MDGTDSSGVGRDDEASVLIGDVFALALRVMTGTSRRSLEGDGECDAFRFEGACRFAISEYMDVSDSTEKERMCWEMLSSVSCKDEAKSSLEK